MKHPDKEQQENQQEFIDNLPLEQQVEYQQLFRIGNAAIHYHRQAQKFNPTESDFNLWLEGLPRTMAAQFEDKGFEQCKGVLSFTRFVMERKDIGMGEWMKHNLSEEDFKEYCNQKSARES